MITYDLHSDPALMEGNVMTEYEEKFSSIGNPNLQIHYFLDNNSKYTHFLENNS